MPISFNFDFYVDFFIFQPNDSRKSKPTNRLQPIRVKEIEEYYGQLGHNLLFYTFLLAIFTKRLVLSKKSL